MDRASNFAICVALSIQRVLFCRVALCSSLTNPLQLVVASKYKTKELFQFRNLFDCYTLEITDSALSQVQVEVAY